MTIVKGNKLKQYIDDKKIPVLEIAKKIGVSRQTMYNYFDKDQLDQEVLTKLSDIGFDIVNYKTNNPGRIPYYDIDFMASNVEIFSNEVSEEPSHYIDIKPFNDCTFALPIFGDSMYPIYQNGDVVLCREVVDKSIIPLGEAYLIVTAEHRLLKYLKKGPVKGVLLAVSENSAQYDSFEIPIEHIKKLYIVKGVIKRKTI